MKPDDDSFRLGKGLPPILGPVQNGKRMLNAIDKIDFDLMGYLLSCHLIVEHDMDEFLNAYYPELDWDAAKLTFEKRVALLSKWSLQHNPLPEIKHLNTLRNRFSHRINYALSGEDLLPFVHYLERVSNEPLRRREPKRVLHLFTLVCCDTFLTEIRRIDVRVASPTGPFRAEQPLE